MIYGQPTITVHKISNQPTFLEKLFSSLTTALKAQAGIPEVKKQLEEVKTLHDAFLENKVLHSRYRIFDESIYQYVYNITFENDEPTTMAYRSIIKSVFNDVVPLVYKLKLHFQHPRPFQLASVHDVALYPEVSQSAQCPAYPSMHACMGAVMAQVCANNFPLLVNIFNDLAEELPRSRMAMGLCIQDDIKAGEEVAKNIIADKEFKIKYKL